MKLVMTLLVRDEEDTLEAHLTYHLQQGVDFIIVTDNRSVDGTRDILRRYESSGTIRVIQEDGDDYSQGRWVTRMARMAYTEYGADWVINSDADEFWWPQRADLKSALADVPRITRLVHAERHDFVPVAADGRPFHARMTVRRKKSFNALGDPLPTKVAHRAHPRITVTQGNHEAYRTKLAASLSLARRSISLAGTRPIEILHFPLRTYEQFQNKIAKGGRAYRKNQSLPAMVGASWRYLFDLYEEGKLPDYYTKQVRSADSIEAGLLSGELVKDERLSQFLEACGVGAG